MGAIESRVIGEHPSLKKPIYAHRLKNSLGFSATVLDVGATITSIYHPMAGECTVFPRDVSAIFRDDFPYFGSTIGRMAGRVDIQPFTIPGTHGELESTIAVDPFPDPSSSLALHGGKEGFHNKLFKAKEFETEHALGIIHDYYSPEKKDSYPGNVTIKVITGISKTAHTVFIRYIVDTDKTTPISITNHTYFNLNPEQEDVQKNNTILEHKVHIPASHVFLLHKNGVPTGKVYRVDNTAFDLRTDRMLNEVISNPLLKDRGGYDHPYLLDKWTPGKLGLAAQVASLAGIALEVYTDYPVVVFYTGNTLDKFRVANQNFGRYEGLCIECQMAPNFVHYQNNNNFTSNFVIPQQKWSSAIEYRFSP